MNPSDETQEPRLLRGNLSIRHRPSTRHPGRNN